MVSHFQSVNRRERVVILAHARHADLIPAEKRDHPFDERGSQKWHVARREVCGVASACERLQSGEESFHRTTTDFLIPDDPNFLRQWRHALPRRGDDDDRRDHLREDANDAGQHEFVADG